MKKPRRMTGDPATRWCNDGTLANAWIQFDLGSSKSVKKARLMLENNHIVTYPDKNRGEAMEPRFPPSTRVRRIWWAGSSFRIFPSRRRPDVMSACR